jgi:hypothetical protein
MQRCFDGEQLQMDPLALRGSKGFKGKALLRLPRGSLVAWAAGRFLTALTTVPNGGYSERTLLYNILGVAGLFQIKLDDLQSRIAH